MISKEIQELIAKYRKTPLEATYLSKLMDIRQNLVALGFELGLETAEYKRLFDSANYSRKISFYQFKSDSLSEGVTKAETLAEVKIKDLRESEKTYESLYYGCKILLGQLNEVLSSIQQDLSILKSELNNG